jgi:hypothetical protein
MAAVPLLTVEDFKSLEVGDQVETFPLWPSITGDKIILHTVQASADRKEFAVTYCGITIGLWACVSNNGQLKWHL